MKFLNALEIFFTEHFERLFWILLGGYIQIIMANKKGIKYNRASIIGTFTIALFVGWWAGHLSSLYLGKETSNFFASISAVGSHSLLNFYSENISQIAKSILKGKFNINIDNETKSDNDKPSES